MECCCCLPPVNIVYTKLGQASAEDNALTLLIKHAPDRIQTNDLINDHKVTLPLD